MNPQAPYDLTRITLGVLLICVLIAASFWTVLPFLGAFLWATTIVVATWPLMLRLQRLAGGRRWVAATLMTLLILAIFILPLVLSIGALFDAAAQGVDVARTYFAHGLPGPPSWVSELPLVGKPAAAKWQEVAAGGAPAFAHSVQPYLRSGSAWLLALSGGLGMVAIHFILTVIIAAILYTRGELAALGVLALARRIAPERGEHVVRLAGMAVRGVALGVIVTAIVQSVLAGAGLWLAGVPRPGLLCGLVFVLCVAQLGPFLVLAPAVVWLYWSGSIGWGSALLVWTILVGLLDNVLRPILIRRGVDLPLLLIIAGVIGGLIGFGIIGLFVGPVILAVTYSLLEFWIRDNKSSAPSSP
jgi:predicted PurR-regulated permease PerM